MKKDDRNALDRVIKECIASGLPGLEADIRRARGALMGMEYAPIGGVCLFLIISNINVTLVVSFKQ